MKKILLSIFLILPFVSISTFAINWDTTNFLDETFWSQNPTSGDIITALYGDGSVGNDRTAYTINWTGVTCNTGNMKVVYLNPGTNTIPFSLSGNTIYVLNEGNYITTGTINMSGCSSLIGSGLIQIYSSTGLTYMIYNTIKEGTILDNININGYGNGSGGFHSIKNSYGIYFYSARNNTINKTSSYNNLSCGVYLYYNSNYNTINNSQFYSNIALNAYGININNNSNNNVINNVLSYNNKYGIYIDGDASRNTINNSQFFNNDYGAFFFKGKYNVFSNVHIYNNYSRGLYIRGVNTSYCTANIFSNINLYNNTFGSIYVEGIQSTGNVFYNTLKLPNYAGTTLNDNYLRPGTGSILGWNTGIIDTGYMNLTSENFVLPNNFFPVGNFLTQGTIGSYLGSTNYYKFGQNLSLQIKPLIYSVSGSIVYSNIPYFSGKIIGESSSVGILGYIRNFQNKGTIEKREVKINLFSYTSGVIYDIYGDLESSYTGSITGNNKIIDIVLSNGYGQKNIYVKYFFGNNVSPEYRTQINYIDIGDSVVLKYYGFNSIYTRNREVNSCDIGQISVQTLNPGENTIPSELSSNTIYILNSGNYITTRIINLTGCSALIGSGNVFLYSNKYLTSMISNIGNANSILENIQIDGYENGEGGVHSGKNDNGIILNGAKNNTINNVVLSNNAINGIYISYESNYNIITSSQFFNVFSGGISGYGVQVFGSHNNTFNNILSYNNNYGVYFDSNPSKNSINNSQFFNNTYGVYFFHGKYNVLSNVMMYNNYYGLYIRGHDSSYCYANVFNTMYIYNNNYGLSVAQTQSTGNLYYNTLVVTSNSVSNYGGTTLNDNYLRPGTGGFMGRSTGIVNTGNIVMSSQYIINPKDRYNNFLINTTTGFTTRKERKTGRSGNGPIMYSFGNNIPLQNQVNKYISFYDANYNIYFSGYEYISNGNLSRSSLFPYGLSVFDIETYLQGNGYSKGTGSIHSVSVATLVGNSPIKGDYLAIFDEGKLNIPVVLQSTGTIKIEALIPSNTYIKNTSNQSFTGLIQAPIEVATGTISGVSGVCSAISVGTYTGESVYFKDQNGNSVPVSMSVPVTACSNYDEGETIGIYTRQENGPWTYMGNATVIIINGMKYVTFNTTHFTDFAVGGAGTGTFVINNNEVTTNSGNVTLHMTMPTSISGMQFSNDGITRSSWEPFTAEKSWSLLGGEGIKTVYVGFDFDGDEVADIQISDDILYDFNGSSSIQGNISLTILGGVTECIYGTSLYLGAQNVTIDPSGYVFSGGFSPSNWSCADFKGLDGRAFSIHTSNLLNDKGNLISGSNILISHDTPTIQGHNSCTGHNGIPTSFNNGTGLVLMEKTNISDNNKICIVGISNVKLQVNVPPYQAPGNYSGTLTLTIPNGF